jgi:hypothetical protein
MQLRHCLLDVLKNLFNVVRQVVELGGPREEGCLREPTSTQYTSRYIAAAELTSYREIVRLSRGMRVNTYSGFV